MELFDTHTHLNDEQFNNIVDQTIRRANEQFVTYILVVGTTVVDSRRAVEIARKFPNVYAAVGIQPNYVSEAKSTDFDEIKSLASDPNVVAIGETGLDRYWDRAPFDLQQDYFARHIELAFETQKPFIVHMRDCEQDILDSLSASKHQPPFQGIMHSYTGTRETAVACLKLGLHISFAGMLTYKKSEELRAVAASIPMDRLLLETDSPYLSPHPKRNHRPNEPSLMIHTAECLAEQKNVSLPEIAGYTTQNALKLFNI